VITLPKEQIDEFCRRNHVRRLALFGSVLRSDFGPASDIDLLVEFEPGERVGFLRLAAMERELTRLLGGRRVDLRTPNELSSHFRQQVLQSALSVYVRS